MILGLSMGGEVTAANIEGCVLLDAGCDGESHTGLLGVTVQLRNSDGDVIDSAESEGDIGLYRFLNLDPGQYQLSVVLPDGFKLGSTTCVDASSQSFSSCDGGDDPIRVSILESVGGVRIKANFLLCYQCWMTGGGTRFEEAALGFLASIPPRGEQGDDGGPNDTAGGVVLPTCSPIPGLGGNWNHPAHTAGMHLHATDIEVIRCGAVDGVEPDVGSPGCPVNFIEFEGTGGIQPLGGADVESRDVCFFGRVEDHNDAGDNTNDGDEVDRYFLRVFDCLTGELILLADENGEDNAGEVDPAPITGGDFRIHCTSCDGPPNDGGGCADGRLPEEFREGLRLGTYFVRGDANIDGGVDISDAIFTLRSLFVDTATLRCSDAADANDDGQLDVSDAVTLLGSLFTSGPLPAPFPVAGIDKTRDNVDCCLLLPE